MKYRFAVGGVWHETNTFAAGVTSMHNFESYQFARGEEILTRYKNTNTELGGVLAAAHDVKCELIPTLYAAAVPSAIIEKQTAELLCEELVERLKESLPVDGIILVLHGAAVSQGNFSLDEKIVREIRHEIGTTVPLVITLDYHANISKCLVENSSVLIGYDTYPHIDMNLRGREALSVLVQILEKKRFPAKAFRKLPFVTTPLKQQTDEFPMVEIMDLLEKVEQSPDVVCGTVAMGFPFSDVPHLGASVLVYADNIATADQKANALAQKIWDLRDRFEPELVPVAVAVQQAIASDDKPVAIVESADNVGGGSAGDATVLLRELLQQDANGAVIVIYDPEAVKRAESAGVGNVCKTEIGGKSDSLHGRPVAVEGVVRKIADGVYEHKGSYMTGYITSMGRTALLDVQGVLIVLTSLRSMPFDAEQLRCLGVEPSQQSIIVVKAAIAWKAAFGEIVQKVICVDTPGTSSSNFNQFQFKNRCTPLYPFETDIDYPTEVKCDNSA